MHELALLPQSSVLARYQDQLSSNVCPHPAALSPQDKQLRLILLPNSVMVIGRLCVTKALAQAVVNRQQETPSIGQCWLWYHPVS